MRKKLLFVIPNLSAGGGEKSLINLLSKMNYGKYEVDLFLFQHSGLFMELLPKQVNVISMPESYRLFTQPFIRSLLAFVRRGQPLLAYNRFLFSVRNRYGKHVSVREQYNWKYLKRAFRKLDCKYDAAIGFLEKTSTYFCIDIVEAERKIGWVHTDYEQLGMDPAYDAAYFGKLDHLVTVSDECAHILKKKFPTIQEKVSVIRNIVSPQVIHAMADRMKEDVYNRTGEGDTVIVTVCRLHELKGLELAIEACELLIRRGCRVKWYVIGEGEERERLSRLIQLKKLERHFILLGLRTNPYPYIKQADIYAQTSKVEGKSIAIDEAKILRKPIVVTNFRTAKDQIEHERTGLIAEMHPHAVSDQIERLMTDSGLASRLRKHLMEERLGTEDEIHKLYALIGGERDEDKPAVCHEQLELRRCRESFAFLARND